MIFFCKIRERISETVPRDMAEGIPRDISKGIAGVVSQRTFLDISSVTPDEIYQGFPNKALRMKIGRIAQGFFLKL